MFDSLLGLTGLVEAVVSIRAPARGAMAAIFRSDSRGLARIKSENLFLFRYGLSKNVSKQEVLQSVRLGFAGLQN